MRVTQSMLSNTMLRNLNSSYTRMATLQEQISTGSKLLRPSDDPVSTTKAMSYRTQLAQNEQYSKNLDTATKWLDTTDTALGTLGSAMTRVQELVTQAANDTNQTEDRAKMLTEIKQLREEVKDIANTKIGDTYIFSGTRTNEPAYVDQKVDNTPYLDASGEEIFNTDEYTQKNDVEVIIYKDPVGTLLATKESSEEQYITNGMTAAETIRTEVYKNSAGQVLATVTKNLSQTAQLPVIKDGDGNTITSNIEVQNSKNVNVLTISSNGVSTAGTAGTQTTENKKVQQYLSGENEAVNIEIYNGIQLAVNTTDIKTMFNKLDGVFEQIEKALSGTNGVTSGSDIGDLLGGTNSAADKSYDTIQGSIDLILRNRSDVGAKQNRVDTMADRLALQKETLTKQQSNVEDVEYEEAITNMITQQSIHNAALSVGGRIIQQTLVDFIR